MPTHRHATFIYRLMKGRTTWEDVAANIRAISVFKVTYMGVLAERIVFEDRMKARLARLVIGLRVKKYFAFLACVQVLVITLITSNSFPLGGCQLQSRIFVLFSFFFFCILRIDIDFYNLPKITLYALDYLYKQYRFSLN